jgi:D-aspartate ligase
MKTHDAKQVQIVADRPYDGQASNRSGKVVLDTSTPVLLLGGGSNGVSVVRNFNALGIQVSMSGDSGSWGLASRHCHKAYPIPAGKTQSDYWSDLLLTSDRGLDGHIIIALCDDSIAFMCVNKAALEQRYILEGFDADLRSAMLDKKETLEIARRAGVPTPDFWTVRTLADLEKIRDKMTFPVMVKPIHSHLFIPIFGRKLFIIESDFDEVHEKVELAFEHGLEIMVVEMIPGPDNLLSSYYTYIDEDGTSLFDYTKCVIRRYPVNRGGGCYHKSVWLPETAEMGRKFFSSVAWRGMGNIEFKHDPRDGQLKVIECNPRFTAAHRLVVAAGLPIDEMIYRQLTGQPVPTRRQIDRDLRMWNPVRDALSFRELNRRGELGFFEWVQSIFTGRKVMPLFSFTDPMPSAVRFMQEARRAFRRG